ncbi:hypothetical protein EDC01DRAFT_626544 [Geopyxis carbonaria]|nr:hypothetical protein EDC01DRAFT_626544 [Geopyxis carbonaria]
MIFRLARETSKASHAALLSRSSDQDLEAHFFVWVSRQFLAMKHVSRYAQTKHLEGSGDDVLQGFRERRVKKISGTTGATCCTLVTFIYSTTAAALAAANLPGLPHETATVYRLTGIHAPECRLGIGRARSIRRAGKNLRKIDFAGSQYSDIGGAACAATACLHSPNLPEKELPQSEIEVFPRTRRGLVDKAIYPPAICRRSLRVVGSCFLAHLGSQSHPACHGIHPLSPSQPDDGFVLTALPTTENPQPMPVTITYFIARQHPVDEEEEVLEDWYYDEGPFWLHGMFWAGIGLAAWNLGMHLKALWWVWKLVD